PLNLNNNIINNLIFNETVDQDSIFSERHEILRITARWNLEQYTEKMTNQMWGEFEALGATTYPELDEIPSNQISIREATRLQSVGLVSCS
ncbi:8302_t:CDS:2, partial [Diversispora eburnea]